MQAKKAQFTKNCALRFLSKYFHSGNNKVYISIALRCHEAATVLGLLNQVPAQAR